MQCFQNAVVYFEAAESCKMFVKLAPGVHSACSLWFPGKNINSFYLSKN